MLKNKGDKIRLLKHAVGLGIILCVSWLILYYIYVSALVPAAGTAVSRWSVVPCGEESYLFESQEGTFEVLQTVSIKSEKLIGLGLSVQVDGGKALEIINAEIQVVDQSTGEVVYDDNVELQDVLAPTNLNIMFENPLENTKDKVYELCIRFSGDDVDKIRLFGAPASEYDHLVCQQNGENVAEDVAVVEYVVYGHFILTGYKVFMAFFSMVLVLLYWMIFVKRSKLENIYLVSVLTLGMIYCIMLVPFSVPDESSHANQIYRITNDLMGVPDTGNPETIYKRVDDANILLNNDANLSQYYFAYSNFGKMTESDELVEVAYKELGVSGWVYAPAIVGFVLSRLLGFGPVLMYMLARVFMLVFYAVLTWYAVKKIPFGKAALFIIGILPVVLQEAASLSYDSVVNAVTLLFTAIAVWMIYSKEPVRKRDLLLTVILGVMLLFSKGGAYLPLLLLLTLVPAQKLRGKKKKWIGLCVFIGVLLVFFVGSSMAQLNKDAQVVETAISTDVEVPEYYSISYLLHNPSKIISVGLATTLFSGSYYISTMIGQRLGFLNIVLDDIVVYTYLIVLVLALFKPEKEIFVIKTKEKVVMAISILGSVALVVGAMWLFMTTIDSGVVMGVQGRYFIPVLWLLLMLFRNSSIVLKKDISRGLIFVALLTQLLVFAYGIRQIMWL